MRRLQSELGSRSPKIKFDALNDRIRCYAHIINLCSSHIIASITSSTKHYLFNESNLDCVATRDDTDDRPDDDESNDPNDGSDDSNSNSDPDSSDNGEDDGDSDEDEDEDNDEGEDDGEDDDDDDSDDEPVDGDINLDRVAAKLELPEGYDIEGNPALRRLLKGILRDPLGRARKVVRLLRSSGQRREGFQSFIERGNQSDLFSSTDRDKIGTTVKVPQLELLRDVKTRWDSVYLMLERLQRLRPVSSSQ